MNLTESVHLRTITALLDGLRAECRSANEAGDIERAHRIETRIGEVVERRAELLRTVFDVFAAVA